MSKKKIQKIQQDLAIAINRYEDLEKLCDTGIEAFKSIKQLVKSDRKKMLKAYNYLEEQTANKQDDHSSPS